jgi:hypothetical protein
MRATRAWANDVNSVSFTIHPHPAVETLDKGILHGFARRDVMPVDAGVISPCQDGVAGKFAAIVTDYHLRLAALDYQPGKLPRHTDAGERGAGHQRQALACAIIDNGQDGRR